MPYWVYANGKPIKSFHTQEAAFKYVGDQIILWNLVGGCRPPVYTVYYGSNLVTESV
jgi:hypothetical protein